MAEEGQERIYCDFINRYSDFPQELLKLMSEEKSQLPKNIEDPNYNSGTMREMDLPSNMAVVSAYSFYKKFNAYKEQSADMSDTEIKARVVFDFLAQHGVDLSYEKNKDDILFADITREKFYADVVFRDAVSNTNSFGKYVGNISILCIQPKSVTDLPRNTEGLSQESKDKFMNIPNKERLEIIYKRGMYHESIHITMGTADERKCDAFALLKIMREHPEHAKTIFDVYNIQRSKIGYTISALQGKDEETRKLAVKSGEMTYLMPNTYKQLKKYALNPQQIPQSDREILKLACQLTSEPEFSKEQLVAFMELMKQKTITASSLAQNEIVQACMQQGGFKNIDDYIACDLKLKNKISEDSSLQKRRQYVITKFNARDPR